MAFGKTKQNKMEYFTVVPKVWFVFYKEEVEKTREKNNETRPSDLPIILSILVFLKLDYGPSASELRVSNLFQCAKYPTCTVSWITYCMKCISAFE